MVIRLKKFGRFEHFSFIHYGDLYSASSRLLLRRAPDLRTAKKEEFWGLFTDLKAFIWALTETLHVVQSVTVSAFVWIKW